jgi:hypothetical protein
VSNDIKRKPKRHWAAPVIRGMLVGDDVQQMIREVGDAHIHEVQPNHTRMRQELVGLMARRNK